MRGSPGRWPTASPSAARSPGTATALAERLRRAAPELAVALAALAAVVALFPGVVLGREHLWGDFVTWYYPSHRYAAERMREWAWPLWNPYSDCGMPFAGEADHASFYPPSWLLHAIVGPAGVYRGLEIFTLLHVAVAILTLYALLRSLGCGRLPSVAGGFVYGLGGEFMARSGHVSLMCAQAWVPLVLGGAYQALRRGSPWSLLASAVALGLVGLSGSPATLVVTVMGLAFLLPAAVLFGGPGPLGPRTVRGLGVAAGVLALGLLLASIQLVPMKEFVGLSERSAFSYDEIAKYSVTPASLILLLVPRFFGWLKFDMSSYWGPNNFVELTAYAGLLPLALALLALRFRPARETLPWLLLSTLALWVALGRYGGLHELLYRHLPLLGQMRAPGRYLLLWALGIAVLAGLGLDAALRRDAGGPREAWRSWRAGLAGAALAFALLMLLLGPAMAPSLLEWQLPFFLAGLSKSSLAAAGAALGLALLGLRRAPVAGALVALLVASDLTLQGRGVGLYPDSPATRSLQEPSAQYEALLRADRSRFRIRDRYANPGRLMLDGLQNDFGPGRHLLDYLGYETLIRSLDSPLLDLLNVKYVAEVRHTAVRSPLPNLVAPQYVWLRGEETSRMIVDPPLDGDGLELISTLHVIDDVPPGEIVGRLEVEGTGGEALVLPLRMGVETGDVALESAVSAAKEISAAYFVDVTDAGTWQRRHYLARLRFAPRRITGIRLSNAGPRTDLGIMALHLQPAEGAPSAWRRVYSQASTEDRVVNLFENPGALARASLVPRARAVRSRVEALALLSAEGFDPRRELLIEGPVPGPPADAAAIPDAGEVRIDRYEPERIELVADVPGGGSWLFLSEVFVPGWSALVDGRPVTILRANGLFRAVRLEGGRHEVVFRYEPRSFALGARLSLLGLLAGLALAGVAVARSRALPTVSVP